MDEMKTTPETNLPDSEISLPEETSPEALMKPNGPPERPEGSVERPVGQPVLGPTSLDERTAIAALDDLGIPERKRPSSLKNRVVKRSKKGPAGALIVRKVTGVENNTAKQLVKQFEGNTGGREDIMEKLQAAHGEGALTQDGQRLLALLASGPKNKSLAHLMADAKVEPLGIMKAYARGCVVLGQVKAAIEAHSRMPELVKDIFRHAIDSRTVCVKCVGSGRIAAQPGVDTVTMESKICSACSGTGEIVSVSKHKEWAGQKVLEMTGQVKSPGGPTVNVQQNVHVGGAAEGFMETLLKVSDKVLFGAAKQNDIVDAEVVNVQPENH